MRVFITGASEGLGFALAEAYAAQGATLGLVARRRERLEAYASQCPVACSVYPLDVRNGAALREAARDFIARHGCPDVVIANAGVSFGTASDDVADLEVFRDIMAVNVLGMAATFQPFISALRAAGKGRLVGIASVAGYRGLPGAAAYCASKAAAISYLESLRVELRASGVRVVTVCPGYIATAMTARNPYPMPFLMNADEAAASIVRVVARGASYAIIPWQMALVARVLRVLPNAVYDPLFARAPRKPRREA